jgi:hypothetical protein
VAPGELGRHRASTVIDSCQRISVAKKATEQTITGEQGIAMIASAVTAMHHIWREAPGPTDFGIDGDIELRDPASGEVRNVRIGVQSRATTRKWAGETGSGFYYTPSKADLDYWLSSNQPVILVCSRPATNEIYWCSLHDWARDPTHRARRQVHFDKTRDRFEASSRDTLFALRGAGGGWPEPPGPAPIPEDVQLNLMPVIWKTELLHSAAVGTSNAKTLFAPAHEQNVNDFRAVLRDGYVWSLVPFREGFLQAISAQEPKSGQLTPWLDSTQPSDMDLVRELLRRAMISAHHRWIAWHRGKRMAYFRLKAEPEEWRTVRYRWDKGAGRAVVSPQQAKTRDGHTGYRHDAAEILVRRLSGRWYLQVHPTYLFTWDGVKVSRHHASALKKIKEIETHPSVSQALRMWAHLLKEKITFDSLEGEPATLGPLVSMSSPRSIIDRSWREVSATELGYQDPDGLTLFDPDNLAA